MSKAQTMLLLQNDPVYYTSFFIKFFSSGTFPYLMNFTNNSLTNVLFNFSQLYTMINSVIPAEDTYLLQKQASILLTPENQIICDCGLYSDFNFIINGAYSTSLKPTGLSTSNLANTYCKYANVLYNIYSLVASQNTTSISKFCASVSLNSSAVSSNRMMTLINMLMILLLTQTLFC